MDLDELFGEGTELSRDVVVKAQLRFRVHPPRHRVAQDIVDRLTSSYDERLDMICDEVDDVLQHADLRRSSTQTPLVLALGALGARARDTVVKAARPTQPYSPGSKGGKWYRDGQGHVRYGEQPQAKFKQRAQPADMLPHVGHYRPGPFMGANGVDREVTSFLMEHGDAHGFSGGELRFLGSWYGTDTHSGALFDAFLECAGLTRDELKGGTVHLRFGAQKLTYEEAVFEFFAAQESLFMGDDSGSSDDQDWNHVLNDEIKPMLDSVFRKYEALKSDESFQQRYLDEPERQRRRFYDNARRHDEDTQDLASLVIGAWDPARQVTDVIAGMNVLGLFAKQGKVERHAFTYGRPHLRGALVMDGRVLSDGPDNPLLGDKEKLSTLSASQLMLLYAAAELFRRWDPETRTYSPEVQAEIGAGEFGAEVLAALSAKSSQWESALGLVRGHMDEMVDRLVLAINHTNSSDGEPDKKKSTRKARKK